MRRLQIPSARRREINGRSGLMGRDSLFFWMFLLVFLFLACQLLAGGGTENTRAEHKIRGFIQEFSGRLDISQKVVVSIVPKNSRLISVEYVLGRTDLFQMLLEEKFLRTLGTRELRAAVAHEMGHIWIYTHFPFLQTEIGANQQAQKLVPRRDLERVYEKVWSWNHEQGSLAAVLGSGIGDRDRHRGSDRGSLSLESPTIFIQIDEAHAHQLAEVLGSADPPASAISAPANPPFNQTCPGCRITLDKDSAAYIAVFTVASDASGKWVYGIYQKNGILLEKGQAATLDQSAHDMAMCVMNHWQKHNAR